MRKKGLGKRTRRFLVDFLILIIACCIGAFSTVCIMIPNGLTSGGLTGITRILQNFLHSDFSILYYIGAFLIFVICLFAMGFKEARKILLLSIMYPATIFLFEQTNFRLLEQNDTLLAAIYCGIFSGICSGLILMRGYSSGGTDTIAKVIKNKWMKHVDISRILLVIDVIIILASALIYGRDIALYALVTTFILSRVIDVVVFGFQTKIVRVEIISDKNDYIADYIMNHLGRGVTFDAIVGAYSGMPSKRLVALCSTRESMLIKQVVSSNDANALMTIIQVDSIWGRGDGFAKIDKE